MRLSWLGLLSALCAPVPALAQDHSGGHSEAAVSGVPVSEAVASAEPADERADADRAPPPLLLNRGNGGFPIHTAVPAAQAYFSNGIELGAAFDHEEATAAMAEAVRLDPECAMCRWGHAYALGPNLNYAQDAAERQPAYAEALIGQRLARAGGDAFEQAMLDALVQRFGPGEDPDALDQAYDAAMRAVAAQFPQHDMAQVLAADASIIASTETEQMAYAVTTLETVLGRNPDHTPAIHFYIHATEIFGEPARAEPYADRLDAMRLSANHLAHMPSHTWYWVGRYGDAAQANVRAAAIGHHTAEAMQAAGEPLGDGGVWDLPYHAHNVIFGIGGALMSDDSRAGLMLARPLVESVAVREEGSPFFQLLASGGYFALARFEDPQVVLALPEPKLPYLQGAWRYARGEAQAFLENAAGLRAEIAALPSGVPNESGEGVEQGPPQQMLAIARAVLTGRLAMLERRYHDAAAAFAEGAQIEETEDFQRFSDPPAFWYPVRRDLARALLAAGDAEGALREAHATLEVRPLDPGALALIRAVETASGG